MAAGRRVSSEAISTLRLPISVRRLAIFAVVVVLPDPCRPTIMITTGGAALRSIGWAVEPSISISWSCTIFTTIWPGVTDFKISTPTARFLTSSVKARATSSATSASSNARRTSRKAASTSASDSAPRRVKRSRIPFSRSDSDSNIYLSCHSGSPRQRRVRNPYPRCRGYGFRTPRCARPRNDAARENTKPPEGASRCRAGASGLSGRSAGFTSVVQRKRPENRCRRPFRQPP